MHAPHDPPLATRHWQTHLAVPFDIEGVDGGNIIRSVSPPEMAAVSGDDRTAS